MPDKKNDGFWQSETKIYRLVKVGVSTWVNVAAIEGINWNTLMKCPQILLSSGGHVNATDFKGEHPMGRAWEQPEIEEAKTDALIERLRLAMEGR